LDGSLSSTGGTGSNSINPTFVRFIDNIQSDALAIVRGDLIPATSTVYRVDAEHIGALLQEMRDAGFDLSRITSSAQMQNALAEHFGVSRFDYRWGDLESFTFQAGTGVIAATTAATLTFTAVFQGARDPGEDSITNAKGDKTGSLAYVATRGTDAFNTTNIVVGEKGADGTLIGKQIEINGRIFTFTGGNDPTMNGTSLVVNNGDRLADGSFAIQLRGLAESSFEATPMSAADHIALQISQAD
jgi:hypothetical protein